MLTETENHGGKNLTYINKFTIKKIPLRGAIRKVFDLRVASTGRYRSRLYLCGGKKRGYSDEQLV